MFKLHHIAGRYILLLKCSCVVDVRKQRSPLGAARQLLKGVSRDDVSADETNRRIIVSALLSQYWTRKHGVKPTLRAEINLNLCTDTHSVIYTTLDWIGLCSV